MKDLLLTASQINKAWVKERLSNSLADDILCHAKLVAQAQLDKILNQPWLDKPDSPGWWWFKPNSNKFPTQIEARDIMIYELDGRKLSQGKWQKAYVLEIKRGKKGGI